MIGWFTIQLLNIFTKICFYTFNSLFFQKFIQMNFFRHHALALHQCFAIFLSTNFSNFFQCLFCIFCPNYFCSTFGDIGFKTFQILSSFQSLSILYSLLSLLQDSHSELFFPFGTTALYLPILKLILRRCSLSAAFSALLAINDCECSDMFTNISLLRFIFLSQNSFLSIPPLFLHNTLHHSPAFLLFSLFQVAVTLSFVNTSMITNDNLLSHRFFDFTSFADSSKISF